MSTTRGLGSTWWPIAARPSSWFSVDELSRSRAYHRPLLRAATARFVARIVLLIGGHVLIVAQDRPTSGWAAVVVVAVGWWLPATVSDWWFEYRHEPRFGASPLPGPRFSTGALLTLVLSGLCAAVLAAFVTMARGVVPQWWWLVVGLVVPLAVTVAGWVEPRMTRASHDTSPLDGAPFAQLATLAGVHDVEFHRMDSDAITGFNALTATGGRQPRIIVSTELLDAPADLTEHVVAHELSHLRLGHPTRSRVAVSVMWTAVALAAGWLAATDVAGAVGPEGEGAPALPVFVVLVLVLGGLAGLPLAFLSRAQERQADESAYALTGPVPVPLLRMLHVTDRALLDPGLVERLLLPHPPPAERLQRGSTLLVGGLPSRG